MPDLGTWANIAEIVGGATVIGGLLLVVFEVHRFRAARRRQEMLTLIRSYQTWEFVKALRVVSELPEDLDHEELEGRPEEEKAAVWFLMTTWESIGVLVHRREVSLDLVEALYGGPVLSSWRKLGPAVEEGRGIAYPDTYWEWFQWLAERIEERESAASTEPAHLAHADWSP